MKVSKRVEGSYLSLLHTKYSQKPPLSFSGITLLGLSGTVTAATENGCDIENDDGILYAAIKDQIVIFTENISVTASESEQQVMHDGSEPWPAIYRLPPMDDTLKNQIKSCCTQEDACRLKSSVSFCNNFLRPIVHDIQRFTGEER